MSASWVYRYEVKGIQSYILASDRLKEMIGASSLVEGLGGLFEKARRSLNLGDDALTVVPPAAGGATLRIGDERKGDLEKLRRAWPMIVAQYAPGLQVIQGIVQEEAGWDEALQRALRKDRSRLDPDLPETGPLVKRAPRTGLRAVCKDGDLGDLDAAGRRKMRKRQQDQDLLGRRIAPGVRWVEDLEEIPHTYVGIFHADGNDMGRRIRNLLTERGDGALRPFSEALSRVTLQAVREATQKVLVPAKTAAGALPARPVIVGGDDVTLILQGDLALEFSHVFLRTLEEESETSGDFPGGRLTAAAGVALVHRSHPFSLGYALAEDLCKEAKKQVRTVDRATPSALAFYRLTTSLSGSYEDILEKALRGDPPAGTSRALLTLSPYVLREGSAGPRPAIGKLRALVDAMDACDRKRQLPRGGIREWVNRLQTSSPRAVQHARRLDAVQTERGGREWGELKAALADLGVDAGSGWAPLGEGAVGTPLLDALSWIRMGKDH